MEYRTHADQKMNIHAKKGNRCIGNPLTIARLLKVHDELLSAIGVNRES